jgi:hypothetical protein
MMGWPPFVPRKRPLATSVVKARAEFASKNEANGQILKPLIGAHLMAYDGARTELHDAHRYIADQTTLDLVAKTRDVGKWLITGRCIGLAHAAHLATSSGFTGEVVPLLRSLHEATRLLGVFRMPGEDTLVNRWLDGRNVSRSDIMAASGRQETATREQMLKHGHRIPAPTSEYFERQYGRWSEFAHHRRKHMLDQVAAPDRVMVAGPHPDWRARAVAVDHFGWYIAELVSVGGFALADLGHPEWVKRFQGTFQVLVDLKARMPLAQMAEGNTSARL